MNAPSAFLGGTGRVAVAALVLPVNLSVRVEGEILVADSTGHHKQLALLFATSLMS